MSTPILVVDGQRLETDPCLNPYDELDALLGMPFNGVNVAHFELTRDFIYRLDGYPLTDPIFIETPDGLFYRGIAVLMVR